MAASVGIGFQCVQCAAEGGFRALTGSPARDVQTDPAREGSAPLSARDVRLRLGAYTETPSDTRAAEDVGPYHGTTW